MLFKSAKSKQRSLDFLSILVAMELVKQNNSIQAFDIHGELQDILFKIVERMNGEISDSDIEYAKTALEQKLNNILDNIDNEIEGYF